MDIKFLTQDNEVQKLYAKFGMVVPVGDLSTGKAPAVQPLSTESTQTSVTAKFNVLSGTDITAMSYTVNDGEAVSVTPTRGVITITLTDLDYNSGPYEIVITAVNENGSTSAKADVALQHYTNWATADEVLEGNKFIGEDGQEAVGTYVPESGPGTGGAVATGNQYNKQDGFMEFPALDITFSTLPDGFDTANHTYYMFVAAPFYEELSGQDESIFKPLIDGNSYSMSTQNNYDSTTQTYTIDFYDLDFTHYGPSIATTVYIFEDDLMHLKWIIPCTFADTTNQQ